MNERFGIYEGIVMERDDPEGRGRVKVQVPGILYPMSDWMLPSGIADNTLGRGIWCVPSKGATVLVSFIHGDVLNSRAARYKLSSWGRPKGVSDAPQEAENGSADIVVMGFKGFAIVIDERTGQEKATLIDRTNGSFFRFDVANKDLLISSARDFKRTIMRNEEITVAGDKEDLVSGKWNITVTGDVKIAAGGKVEVKATGDALLEGATGVKIGDMALEFVALKTELQLWAATHKHLGVQAGSGTSGIADTPLADSAFSTKTKVE